MNQDDVVAGSPEGPLKRWPFRRSVIVVTITAFIVLAAGSVLEQQLTSPRHQGYALIASAYGGKVWGKRSVVDSEVHLSLRTTGFSSNCNMEGPYTVTGAPFCTAATKANTVVIAVVPREARSVSARDENGSLTEIDTRTAPDGWPYAFAVGKLSNQAFVTSVSVG